MEIKELGGHSGCKIWLMEDEYGRNFVRKISSDVNYNIRLECQAKKQAEFKSDNLRVPKVLECGYTDQQLYYFDMEYVQGVTLAQGLKYCNVNEIVDIVDCLLGDLKIEQECNADSINSIFSEKILQLSQSLEGLNNTIINEAIDILKKHSWNYFSSSFCHGDLTLENIILKNGELYLIDFLDSFYDSFLLDLGTLLQDVQVLWSYRKEKNLDINLVIKLVIFRDLLIDKIEKVNPIYSEEIQYALLLKLVRIFPYIDDKETWDFLECQTNKLVQAIKNERQI